MTFIVIFSLIILNFPLCMKQRHRSLNPSKATQLSLDKLLKLGFSQKSVHRLLHNPCKPGKINLGH